MQSEIGSKCIIVRDGKVPYPVETRPDEEGIVRMYCILDHSSSCIHSRFAWTLPKVQEMVQRMYVKMREVKEAVQ
jgi:hypothetical protein